MKNQISKAFESSLQQYRSNKVQALFLKGSNDLFDASKSLFNFSTLEWEPQFVVLFLTTSNRLLGIVSGYKKLFLQTGSDLTSIYRYALSLNAQHVAIVSNFPTKHIISESDKLTVVREFQMAMKKLGVDLIDVVEVTAEVKPYSILNKL